jgi:hypothetical protein
MRAAVVDKYIKETHTNTHTHTQKQTLNRAADNPLLLSLYDLAVVLNNICVSGGLSLYQANSFNQPGPGQI